MTDSPKAVFLSYASQDARAAARICEALRAAGIEVWFDQSELRGGDAWDHKIREQVRDCALFIPIISEHTQARPEGYFRLEWDAADHRSHMIAHSKAFIVPVCLDGTTDKGAMVPESFLKAQWTRLPGGETPPAFCNRIAMLLDGMERVKPRMGAEPPLITKPSAVSHRREFVAGVGLILATLIAWQVWRLMAPQLGSQPAAAVSSATASNVHAAPEKSIAVLPFVDMSEKKDQEYFSDGLSEELIDRLAHNAGLRVIARTSAFAFKGKNEDMRTIATKLGVANLLEGSVRKAGVELRVTAQLIRASDGAHLWSQSFDRRLTDIFKVQEEISATVAAALDAALSNSSPTTDIGTSSLEAYNLLLQARYFSKRGSDEGLARAVQLLRQAVKLDPGYARAWTSLAYSYGQQKWDAKPALRARLDEQARRAVDTALRLDPKLARAHAELGLLYLDHREYDAGSREIAAALALDPTDAWALNARGNLAFRLGRWDEGIEMARQAALRDPLATGNFNLLAGSLSAIGRSQEAEQAYRRALALVPDQEGIHALIAGTLFAEHKPEAALNEVKLEPDEDARQMLMAYIYPALDRRADGDAALEQYKKKYADTDAFGIALIYANRNDTEHAIAWLNRAYSQDELGLNVTKGNFDGYPGIRRDTRYKALLRKLNLPET